MCICTNSRGNYIFMFLSISFGFFPFYFIAASIVYKRELYQTIEQLSNKDFIDKCIYALFFLDKLKREK